MGHVWGRLAVRLAVAVVMKMGQVGIVWLCGWRWLRGTLPVVHPDVHAFVDLRHVGVVVPCG